MFTLGGAAACLLAARGLQGVQLPTTGPDNIAVGLSGD
jgi:hypothetical protein